MSAPYSDPVLTVAVLDFKKPAETRLCLESIKAHILFPHHVVYAHNGNGETYPYDLFREGLIDTFIQTKTNGGLGLGTRAIMAASFSPYALMLQNDQVIDRDFGPEEFMQVAQVIDSRLNNASPGETPVVTVKSVSLAGPAHPTHQYSERCHLVQTSFYRDMETAGILGPYGAGPFHDGPWREEQIQRHYKTRGYLHFTWHAPLVRDNGVWTIRDIAGGTMRMRTDTKQTTWLKAPTKTDVFPDHTPEEWTLAIRGEWPKGQTPSNYTAKRQVFNCWGDAT